MKSWSERFVAGLKNWRSRKNISSEDAAPETQYTSADTKPHQSVNGSQAEFSVNGAPEIVDRIDDAMPKVETTNPPLSVSVAGDETQAPVLSPDQPELTNEVSREPSTPTSVTAPQQKPSRRKSKSSREGNVTVETLSTSDGQEEPHGRSGSKRVARSSKLQSHNALQKGAAGKVRAKALDKANGKPATPLGTGIPSVASVPFKKANTRQKSSGDPELPIAEQATGKDTTAATASRSKPIRSRVRKSEHVDDVVTDEVLAELEEENAHLKRLLREKSSASHGNSGN
ncbi:hypothetical protein KXR64_20130 [Brucella intermedia]|uniref:hypothetical protein n=1 Tax=Brucella TaxID=234 RepID=UPI0011151466|nr:hypothetical protein [Brucella intermedia]